MWGVRGSDSDESDGVCGMMANVYVLFFAFAKVAAMTALGPGIVLAILAEKYKVVEVGIEQISVSSEPRAQLANYQVHERVRQQAPRPEVRRYA